MAATEITGSRNSLFNDDGVVINSACNEQKINLISSFLFLTGSIIGTGIFISSNSVVKAIPSVFFSLSVWVFCGVISLLAALCYAEMGSKFPSLGGEYTYFREVYHEMVSFSYIFTNFFMIRPVCIAILIIFFAKNVLSLVYENDYHTMHTSIKLISALTMILICTLNCLSEKYTIVVNDILTYLKFLCMGIVIILALIKIFKGQYENISDPGFKISFTAAAISSATYNGMWAYDGFNSLGYIVDKIDNPQKNLVLASVLGMSFIVVVYLLINFAYIIIIGVSQLTVVDNVVLAAVDPFLGKYSRIISVLVGLSAFSTANATSYAGGNLYYDAGHNGHFPVILGSFHKRFKTFIPALIGQALITIFYILVVTDMGTLIEYFSGASWVFYSLVFLAVIIARYSPTIRARVKQNSGSKIEFFILIPIITFIVSSTIVILGFFDNWRTATVSVSIIAASVPVYYALVFRGGILPQSVKLAIDKFTKKSFEKFGLTDK